MHYVFGAYSLDTQRYELHHAEVPVPLRPKVFEVLAYLVAQHARVVGKEELLEAVWPGRFVGDAGLNSYIMAVRTALEDRRPPHQFLRTVRGYGYRFVALVEVRDQAQPTETSRLAPPPAAAGPAPASSLPPAPVTPGTMANSAGPAVLPADGEYKPVSVLCGTLANAPTLAAVLGPEGLYRLLQTVVALAQEVMQRYAGTLTPHASGEGFTAVFGAPVAQEDHARRAILAALDLRERLRQHPALHALTGREELALSMGVHSGLVVVGGLGADPQRLVTAVGAPTHLAARLQQRATPGTILVSAATAALVQEEVRVEACGGLALEGHPAPLPVYTVQGLAQRHGGVPQRPSRSRSPFVGRQRELALLHDRLAAVRTGADQVVSLVGAPGMGKTRLLTEFGRSLAGQPVTWYVGHCLAYGQTTPYLPVREIVQQVCALAEGDLAEARSTTVRRRLEAMGSSAEEDVALLLQLLDLPVRPETLARLSPEVRYTRTFALLRQLVLDEAQRQPLILAVENLHWIDPTSEAWLASLVERLSGAAVLLLVTHRPGYQPPWGAHAAVTQLALPPLRAAESQAVVQAIPGTVQLPTALCQQIVARGAGNPFFVEELTWHAVEHDSFATPVPVPETVHAVLAARMDQLPPEAKRLLQTAAVLGMQVSVPLLRAVMAWTDTALHTGLQHLQAAEFLYETRVVPTSTYTFKHALTQEVAYASLLQERRRALHSGIVEALEALAGDRVAEQVDRLAHHALRGEVWDKALAYCQQAGEKALARWAYREAGAYFEQALSALPHLPETRDTHAQAIDLRLALRSALRPLGEDFGRILAYLREAESLAAALDDARRLGQVSLWLASYFYLMGVYDQAIAAAQRALALATDSGEVGLLASANYYLGLVYQSQGDHRRAIDHLGQAIASLDGARRHERFGETFVLAVTCRAWLARCHAELGTFAEGRTLGNEGLRMAEALEHPPSLMIVSWGVGLLALRQGDLPTALLRLERAVALCHEADLLAYFPNMAATLGAAYTLGGRIADAMPLLTRAVERAMATEQGIYWALCHLSLAEAQLLAGRLEEAQSLAERALALAREHQERGNEAYALHLLGAIAARRDPPESEQAKSYYQQALTLAEVLGMRPLQAHCHLGLGTLYAKIGRPEPARVALATATALYCAMAMTFWLPQAEVALAQIEAGG